MPTVSVNRDLLFKILGKTYDDKEFDELCFQYGIELDDVAVEEDGSISYKIEVGANRYDLLCVEGIGQALSIYLGHTNTPRYSIAQPKDSSQQKIVVKAATAQIRQYCVGAVLRGITFNKARYDSFIALQDKLHQNIARKRTLVAIGTHDLSSITGPFVYDALPPQQINFVPLNKTTSYRADKLLELYLSDPHLREYVPIIKDSPVYPIITDSKGVVLSMPPIINGEHSKITLNTKDVFIECTATDKFKAQIVLDTLVCMFSGYCVKPFTVEPVQVEYESSGVTEQYPVLEYRPLTASVAYCNSLVGVSESAENIAEKLTLMGLQAQVSSAEQVEVILPPTRYDVLHECDVAEDFAVAYGFDKLAEDLQLPPTNTIGQEYQLNYHTDKLRLLLSQNNYTEAATFALCSKADLGEKLRMDLSREPLVEVGNPKTVDCEAVRLTLLPGLLRTAAANKHIALPLRLFEISDVGIRDERATHTRGTGARNERHLCALNYNVRAGMEVVQGLLDNLMLALKVPFNQHGQGDGYWLEGKDHPTFLSGFCGRVMVNGREVGKLGLLHPEVIIAFNLNNPASALDLNLQDLIDLNVQPF
ncbi:Phenylalanyl-tRNA synthetase class IIc beta subunit archae/euk cytosolic [Trinorchestia longiramus]|nr:Phenylalanyl-tRNA synthetase class IIc beta subunit archae/euk cytosolic [Trinorchestia longiramus]